MQFQYNTDRLQLRILDDMNAERVLEFYTNGKESFNAVEPPKTADFYTIPYQSAILKSEFSGFLRGTYARYYIFHISNPNIIIGTVSFSNILRGPYNSCIIGYKLLPEYRGKGYASEAVSRLISAVFSENFIHRIEAYVLPSNTASIKLLAGLGFTCEGVARSVIKLSDGYRDHNRYVLINPMD